MAIIGMVFALTIFFFTIGLRLFCFAVVVGFKLLGLILRFLGWSIKALIYLLSRGKYGSISIKAFEDEEKENWNDNTINNSSSHTSSTNKSYFSNNDYTVKENDWKDTKQSKDNNSDVIYMNSPMARTLEYRNSEEFKNRIKYRELKEKYGIDKDEDIITKAKIAQTEEEKEDFIFLLKEYRAWLSWCRETMLHPSRRNIVREYD